jgi:two-component system, NtrC family, response regulator PilR
MSAKPRVLVLDDEPDLRALYEIALSAQGCTVDLAADLREARELMRYESFDLLLTDMRLPDGLGLDLVQEVARQKRNERCVVITAYGSAENAVAALKAGAFDYLTKPVDLQHLRRVVSDALAADAAHLAAATPLGAADKGRSTPPEAAATALEPDESSVYALSQIVGQSAAMTVLKAKVAKVALSMAPVLVAGESGTGKELVARALHACSHRRKAPFVAVNCAAIPESLLEAEFFGAVKGAYTGAVVDRVGFFQQASGGTLFLDEIGELPLLMQSKLLRAIQERQVRPLGASSDTPVDVRIVSATHRDLAQAVAHSQFRQDLFYRIHVIELRLPPLRERQEDLAELADVLLARIVGRPVGEVRISQASLRQLQQQPLPGNVRELENLLHRAWALADPHEQELELFDDTSLVDVTANASGIASVSSKSEEGPPLLPRDLTAYLDEQERGILLHALAEHQNNRTAAAGHLGISLRQMRYRMQRLKIELRADDSD